MSFATDGSPLVPGYRLDNYELLCPVAEGGMAQVWLARKTGKHGFEKLVAIKTILPKYASDDRFQRMFLDEARIASRITHPNVAHIFDLGEEHDVLYLAMEWVDGESISKLLRAVQRTNTPFPLGIALRILSDVCGGLSAAHELKDADGNPLGVVHRDVSPQNVLVTSRGVAKLIDFGVAKARDRVSGDTSTGLFKGKVQYMAPEQALGRPVDARADLWAVGALLYTFASGDPPFQGDNQVQTLYQLTTGKAPPPLPKTVHPAVLAIVDKALAFAPENRYASARDMQRALDEAIPLLGGLSSATDVAAFCREHLHESAQGRKQAIEMALKAAEDRARIQELMAPAADSSSPHGVRHRVGSAGSAPSSTGLVSAVRSAPPVSDPPLAESTTGMGSATFDAPLPFASGPERRRLLVVAMTAAIALGLVGLASFYAGARSTTATASSAEPSASALVVAPAAPSVVPSAAAATEHVAPERFVFPLASERPAPTAPKSVAPPREPRPEPRRAVRPAPPPERPTPARKPAVDDGF